MNSAVVGLLNVVIGGMLAVTSTATVEFFKDRREKQRADAQRNAERVEESRKAYHELVSSLQEALRNMMNLAGELSIEDGDENREREMEDLRRAEMECEQLISRLPYPQWRETVLHVVSIADQIRSSPTPEGIDKLLDPARDKYSKARDILAEPLREFYREAAQATSSTAAPT